MKDYLIPIAIVVGAIIISATTYMAVTSHDRQAFELCMKIKDFPSSYTNERKIFQCRALVYAN